MKYTSVDKIGSYLLVDIDVTYQDAVDEIITGVSKLFDAMANRKLVAEEGDAVRYFDGNGKTALLIDDFVSITTLEIGDTYGDNLAATTSYVLYPKNADEPRNMIMLKDGSFTPGVQNVKVTGKWGAFAETPADIELAATIVAAGILNNQLKGNQAKKSEAIGSYSVSYGDDKGFADYDRAIKTIDSYKRYSI
jgi:hypothetical protein